MWQVVVSFCCFPSPLATDGDPFVWQVIVLCCFSSSCFLFLALLATDGDPFVWQVIVSCCCFLSPLATDGDPFVWQVIVACCCFLSTVGDSLLSYSIFVSCCILLSLVISIILAFFPFSPHIIIQAFRSNPILASYIAGLFLLILCISSFMFVSLLFLVPPFLMYLLKFVYSGSPLVFLFP